MIYNSYTTITELEKRYPKDDIVFMSDKYYRDDTERLQVIQELILAFSRKIDSYVTVYDPSDPDIKDMCCRGVFYMLCQRHRAVTPEVAEDYNFLLRELKQYQLNDTVSEGLTGKDFSAVAFGESQNIIKGGYRP